MTLQPKTAQSCKAGEAGLETCETADSEVCATQIKIVHRSICSADF